jgi:ribosome-binding protein aMBF1 (putative translation factor)
MRLSNLRQSLSILEEKDENTQGDDRTVNQHVAEKIKAAKEASGGSQNDVADSADLSKAQLSLIKHGKRNPSVSSLNRLAKSGVKLDPGKLE